MITKAVIMSINQNSTRCTVWMPLFDTAGSSAKTLATALVNITPGIYNNLFVGDVVLVSFEENEMEKPIILGKLFTGAAKESKTKGGMGILDTLLVRDAATIPSSTLYNFPDQIKSEYTNLKTPKKVADYIKWLEQLFKTLIYKLNLNFLCFKNWVHWKLKPENLSIDDGDLSNLSTSIPCGDNEGDRCQICGLACDRRQTRNYTEIDTTKIYPSL